MTILILANFAPAKAATLSLSDFLNSVKTDSPDLKIEKSLSDGAQARSKGIRLSPPMVGLMNMRDGSGTNRGFEVTQQIPFPTKILKEKEVRALESKTQNSLFSYRKNEIVLEARQAYFDYWKSYQLRKILDEKQVWLKNHVKIARSTARADSTAQIHLLGTESEADQLENEGLEAATDVIEKSNALKIYAPNLNTKDVIPELDPKLEIIEVDQKVKSGFLSAKEDELKLAKATTSLNKQSYLPDIVLRYRTFNGNDTTPKSEEIMVGITLPFLFFWQPHAESTEASAREFRVQAELQKLRLTFEGRLANLTEKSNSLKKQLLTLKEKLIPRAHKRMKLVDNLSARTMEGLEEHRTVMFDYLNLRLNAINVRVEYEKTSAEILKLMSKEVEL
ncbi:MAG: TolC family protein [Bdellovibrionaceae bacterium]|nr:TolC family protein [Bdellovibrio sp.]